METLSMRHIIIWENSHQKKPTDPDTSVFLSSLMDQVAVGIRWILEYNIIVFKNIIIWNHQTQTAYTDIQLIGEIARLLKEAGEKSYISFVNFTLRL